MGKAAAKSVVGETKKVPYKKRKLTAAEKEKLLQCRKAYNNDKSPENEAKLKEIEEELKDSEMTGMDDVQEENGDGNGGESSSAEAENGETSPPGHLESHDVPRPSVERGNISDNPFEVNDLLEVSMSRMGLDSTNSGITDDGGKIEGFQKVGLDSTKLITRYGPRNAPYWRIEHGGIEIDPATAIDLADQKMVNKRDSITRKYPKITGRVYIQGVAINDSGISLSEAVELLRPKIRGEPKRSFPETQVRVRFTYGGENIFRWETRTDVTRLFRKKTDQEIFNAFVIQARAYGQWFAGETKSVDRSPTPYLALNGNQRLSTEVSPTPAPEIRGQSVIPLQTPLQTKTAMESFEEVRRDWCLVNNTDEQNIDDAGQARLIRVWQIYKRENAGAFV